MKNRDEIKKIRTELELTTHCDTIQIMSKGMVLKDKELIDTCIEIYIPYVSDVNRLYEITWDEYGNHFMKISPVYAEKGFCSFAELRRFVDVLAIIANFEAYQIKRFDLALDTEKENVYEDLYKINFVVGKCFKNANRFKQCNLTFDDEMNKKEIYIKGKKGEYFYTLTIYNKKIKNPNEGIDMRIECRIESKRDPLIWETIKHIYKNAWKVFFQKSILFFENIAFQENEILLKDYKTYESWHKTWSSYALVRNRHIFTRKQLACLIKDLSKDPKTEISPKKDIKNTIKCFLYKYKHFELFSKRDIERYLNLWIESMEAYFEVAEQWKDDYLGKIKYPFLQDKNRFEKGRIINNDKEFGAAGQRNMYDDSIILVDEYIDENNQTVLIYVDMETGEIILDIHWEIDPDPETYDQDPEDEYQKEVDDEIKKYLHELSAYDDPPQSILNKYFIHM